MNAVTLERYRAPLPLDMAYTRAIRALLIAQARQLGASLTTTQVAAGKDVDLSHWVKPMAEALRPFFLRDFQRGATAAQHRILQQLHTKKGLTQGIRPPGPASAVVLPSRRQVRKAALGLDFDVYNPKALDAVDAAVLQFCRETNATVSGDLNTALAELRRLLKAGIPAGEVAAALALKIRKLFHDPARAYRIAVTEQSRALHLGQLMAAKESGVVIGKEWIASADACELCLSIMEKGPVKLDEPFHVDPKGGPYAVCMHPPVHPHDMCSIGEVLGKPETLKPHAISVPAYAPGPERAAPAGPTLGLGNISGEHPPQPWAAERPDAASTELAKRLNDDADAQLKARRLAKHKAAGAKALDRIEEVCLDGQSRLKAANIHMSNMLKEEQTNRHDLDVQRRKQEAITEMRQAAAQLNANKQKRNELREQVEREHREALATELVVLDPVPVEAVWGAGRLIPNDLKTRIDDITTLLSRVLGRSAANEAKLRIKVELLGPHDRQREHHNRGTIWLLPQSTHATVLHEIGHALEYLFPRYGERVRTFWWYRCGNNAPVNMRARFGDFYDPDEQGYPDDFGKVFGAGSVDECYTGRRYPGGATEITSMGLQALLEDPARFAKADPEYFALLAGMLRGDLR